MLSLPLILPQDDNSTWPRTTYRPRPDSPPPAGLTPQQAHRQRQIRDEERRQLHARSPLALLATDEEAIEQRKANVRNFGSQWIRPPGVPKTLQAMTEEQLEREEQAEIERQEAGLRDMQAQQQLAETRQRAAEAEAAGDAEEVDLDAEIPDADAERDLDDDISDADDADEELEATGADVTSFNEGSVMEGSHLAATDIDVEQYAEMEEAELTGAARDEEELGLELERDLDNSVPEAGSYQHTDTEIEDSDSESELHSSFIGRTAGRREGTSASSRRMNVPPGLEARIRSQVAASDSLARSPGDPNLSSSILDASIMGNSPVTQRANGGARGRGGGRVRRGRYS